MKTVATFREPAQAHIARGRLESEGIAGVVLDEQTVGINWLYSRAIGGVRLQVGEADHERACAVLKENYEADLAEVYAAEGQDVCPSCGSSAISPRPYSRWWLIPALVFMHPIFYRRKKWKCDACGAGW